MITIHDILRQYASHAQYCRDKGDFFERLVCAWLKLDPQYVPLFSDVWLWKDWPERERLGFQLQDTGIDLVAKLRAEEGYCAIQCKFHESTILLEKLGTFFAVSGKGHFTQRMIVATAPLSKNAADALVGQHIPVQLITLEDLEYSPIDWEQFSLDQPDQLRKTSPKQTRGHQTEALEDVLKGFESHDRGKLIMACGTGKTYTSLLIAQEIVRPGGHVLFLVPSIALLSQTLRAWTADASVPLRCFAVCSDTKASHSEEDIRIYELAYPATTHADKLSKSMVMTQDDTRLTVVFSTYQSIDVVHEAHKQAGITFDLVISDEAHRTAGYTPPGEDHSAFVRVHDPEYIRANKRLYMTATPRIYAEKTKAKAENTGVQVFSMDQVATFGPEFHRLRFDQAVKRDLLSDYKVLVIAVDEHYINQALNARISDKSDELNLPDAAKIVGCWNGLGKHMVEQDGGDLSVDPKPMRTAIAFAGTIQYSKLLSSEFQRIADDLGPQADYLPRLEARHVDGSMNIAERNARITWLKENIGIEESMCRILTNARCLSEGVDVPALDAAIFLNPRDSVVDVVQSVGRVMRKAPGKKYGYVILPIPVRMNASPENALDDNKKYRVVWQVLNALRAHDDRLDKQFATIDLTGEKNGVVDVIGVGGGNDRSDKIKKPTQLEFAFDPEELGKWQDAIFAKIVHKCGNRRYWEDWAKDVADIAERHQMRIKALLDNPNPQHKAAFDAFLDGLRKNLNPSIGKNEAIEMLAQHIITRPVFDALFEGYAFTAHNPVSQSMQSIMDVLDAQALPKEHELLEGFYQSVRERVSGITDPAGRQRIIVELYDKFFNIAFPKMVERLGIVYTPVEIVDFIINSADAVLQAEFGCCLQDQGIHILDPFTGTGTFLVRLIESGLIPAEDLVRKYQEDLHANEIVLLAYYIAAINIEEAFHRVTGQPYQPFPGIVLTDTFQMNEWDGQFETMIPENSERAKVQKKQDIRVIIGNPPYSVGQKNANDNNQNLAYQKLDKRIRATYAEKSSATNKNSLYDSYIRAFRWASDRLKDQGVICFVTNGGWIDGNTMDGFRGALEDEFSAAYVFNLRGNQRTSGELSRREGGKVFGSGSRTPVAITLLVKKPEHQGKAHIYYYDIGDYLSREDKLDIVSKCGDYRNLPWAELKPNEHHDWINQRSGDFQSLVSFNNGPNAIFAVRSNGVQTNRDAWVYNFSRSKLTVNMQRTITFYNEQVGLYSTAGFAAGVGAGQEAAKRINTDPRKIKWTGGLIADLRRKRKGVFDAKRIGVSMYRPFCKSWLYYDQMFNHRYKERFYPTVHHTNIAIMIHGTGSTMDFTCLVVDALPNLLQAGGGQCFPLNYYNHGISDDDTLVLVGGSEPSSGYVRKDGITDVALVNFRQRYEDASISKEDIFYYCYGILHSPDYRERYASDLKKSLPHVPYAPDFWAFSKAGRKLAEWHLHYETVEPYPLEEKVSKPNIDPKQFYRVEKMRFPRKQDKSTIIFNPYVTLSGIPPEAYDYVVIGRSAIEWIMDRYQITTDKDSGIVNDPNDWSEDPAYILNLLKQIIRVSLETVRIVNGLPALNEDMAINRT